MEEELSIQIDRTRKSPDGHKGIWVLDIVNIGYWIWVSYDYCYAY